MRYWFDTEFIEDGKTIDLISIGIVAEDGREYYALNYDCDWDRASDWVKGNVLSNLPSKPLPVLYPTAKAFRESKAGKQGWRNKAAMAEDIIAFCNPEKYEKPEFWAYYAATDWVAFYQIFGTMMDLPKGFPMYCRDIKQECDRLGNPELPKQGKGEHSALEDARWNRRAWEYLRSLNQDLAIEKT
jgi:hypothetical protein